MDAAGVILEDPLGRVLVLLRSDGFWDIPGGGAEARDTGPFATAMRELVEETGYGGEIEVDEYDGAGTAFYEDAYGADFDNRRREGVRYSGPYHPEPLGWKARYVVFRARVPRAFEPKLSHEHQAHAWVHRDDVWRDSAARPLHEGIKQILFVFCCRFG